MLIEGSLTLIVTAVAFGWPKLASRFFSPVEQAFAKLARRRGLAVLVVGLTALLLRLAVLPICQIPYPFVPDDFSFLLAADTFASGRLTNHTPLMWVHFESIHITMHPTYMSMYFPAQGLLLAAGKVLTGDPWYGVLVMSALMCAAICWMLQAWLPPTWALLGGMLAVLRIGLFSCWTNSYHTGGAIAASAGALILGALPRFRESPRLRYSLTLAVGVILLAGSRPYEGLLLCLPVAASLAHWLSSAKNRPPGPGLLCLSAAPLLLIFAAGGWLAYYNYRAFGSPLILPYTVNRNTYAIEPYFVWQSPRPEPLYRHAVMQRFYEENELAAPEEMHTIPGFLDQALLKGISGFLFFAGIALVPPLFMLRRVLLDRRTRFLVLSVAVVAAGMLLQIYLLAYYLAPFTATFYALGLQAMRHLRQARLDGRPFGIGLVRMTIALCVLLAGIRLAARPLALDMPEWPPSAWNLNWYGPMNFGAERAQLERQLEQLPGKQLVIVRYSGAHNPLDEWVYNAADIDASQVIWAREMDMASNLELIRYYTGRQVWLVQPDTNPPQLSPYSEFQ